MATLQLAENGYLSEYRLAQADVTKETLFEYYVPVNDEFGNVQWIREDYFDDMPELAYERTMNEAAAGVMNACTVGMAEPALLSFWGKKAKARRKARRERRQQKKDARAAGKIARAKARAERAKTGTRWIDKLTDTAGKVIGGLTTQQAPERSSQGISFEYDTLPEREEQPKKWYQNPVVILGGVFATGLVIYALTRKKK